MGDRGDAPLNAEHCGPGPGDFEWLDGGYFLIWRMAHDHPDIPNGIAMVLARCLRDAADYREAFAVCQRLRQPRAERMVSYAQEVNKYKRISTNPIAVWLRDALVPLFLRKAASDTTNRWIYDYQIDWDMCSGRERKYAQAH